MRSQLITTIAALFIINCLNAQTKLIAHKSHSGSDAAFRTMFESNDPELENSDFGLPSTDLMLDSVIMISKTKAVIVSSEVFRYYSDPNKNKRKLSTTHDTINVQSGSKQQLREVLKKKYGFRNNVDTIKIIHYKRSKNADIDSTDISVIPFSGSNNNNPGANAGLFIMGAIILISLMTGFIKWLYSRMPVIG